MRRTMIERSNAAFNRRMEMRRWRRESRVMTPVHWITLGVGIALIVLGLWPF